MYSNIIQVKALKMSWKNAQAHQCSAGKSKYPLLDKLLININSAEQLLLNNVEAKIVNFLNKK